MVYQDVGGYTKPCIAGKSAKNVKNNLLKTKKC